MRKILITSLVAASALAAVPFAAGAQVMTTSSSASASLSAADKQTVINIIKQLISLLEQELEHQISSQIGGATLTVVPVGGGATSTVTVTSVQGTGTYTVVASNSAGNLSAAQGGVGSMVTISGSGFSTTALNNIQFTNTSTGVVNGFQAVSPNGNTLTFTIPSGTALGSYSVQTEAAGSSTWSPSYSYSVISSSSSQPTIDSVSPSGIIPAGSTVTVNGANFNTAGTNTVQLIDSLGNIKSISAMSADGRRLTFVIPQGTAANSYRIQILNGVNANASSAYAFNVN